MVANCQCEWDEHFERPLPPDSHAYLDQKECELTQIMGMSRPAMKCAYCREHHTVEAFLKKLNG